MKRFIVVIVLMFINGCDSETSESSIDMADYLPMSNVNKQYTDIEKRNGDFDDKKYIESVIVEPNLITIKRDKILESITTISNDVISILSPNDNNKTKIYKREVYLGDEVSNYLSSTKRKPLMIGLQRVGEESTDIQESCTYHSKVESYEVYFYEYTNYDENHDIIKLKCISKKSVKTFIDAEYINDVSYENGTVESKENISYVYLQKSLGVMW